MSPTTIRPGTGSYNCYYKRDTSGNWSNGGWLTDEVHVYDMAEFDGKMFACGYGLWGSDDGGANWSIDNWAGRRYAFLPYGDQLMTASSFSSWTSSGGFRYWKTSTKTWVTLSISAATAFPDQTSAVGSNLKLDPAGTSITNRLDPAHDLSASVLHMDLMTSFEAAGEASPIGVEDGNPKVGLYANSQGRICVRHGCLDAQGGYAGVVETETGMAVPTNGWCRVSVAFDATVEPGGDLPDVEMFSVRINGELLRSPAAYSGSWKDFWMAGTLPTPTSNGVWFPSGDGGPSKRDLACFVLKGSGKVDDVCVVSENPFAGPGERSLLLMR